MNYIAAPACLLLVFGSIVALTTADIPPIIECAPVNCTADCPVNLRATPCPACDCDPPKILYRRRRGSECSMPKCESPCKLAYAEGSCPTCNCEDSGNGEGNPPETQCGPANCDLTRCWMDQTTKPCPSCKCGEPSKPTNVECGPLKCEENCYPDYTTSPCASCKCGEPSKPTNVECGPLKCEENCYLDYTTSPCASCKCDNAEPSKGSGSMPSANAGRGYYGG